jgi:GNAT superfamily N-acetyltransferase
MADPPSTPVVIPANEASWDDLATIFGTRGTGCRCFCQRYKLAPRESFGSFPAQERAQRLRSQTNCGRGDAETTTGLVAYLGPEPVGWCAVQPRREYSGLLRAYRVPWAGRSEDRSDPGVWSVTCVFVRARFRRRGISRAMVAAAAGHARRRGARAVEGYPIVMTAVIEEELNVGTISSFAAAGFEVVSRPVPRRVVMRIDFPDQ